MVFRIGARYDLGLAILPHQLAIIDRGKRQRFLQFRDPQTGKLQYQTNIPREQLTTTGDLITASDRHIFLETTGLVQSSSDSYSYHHNGQATIIAYDIKTGKPRFRTEIPNSGGIFKMQTGQNTLQIRSDSYYDPKKGRLGADPAFLAIDPNTGRILWRKSYLQLNCTAGYSWRVDLDTVYLNCDRYPQYLGDPDSSTIMALSEQTGQIKWQYLASPDRYSPDLPNVVSPHQFLTFRFVKGDKRDQTQAIALDRKTGQFLWSFPLHSNYYADEFRQTVATDEDKFFVLDFLPRWQIWLLQRNLNW